MQSILRSLIAFSIIAHALFGCGDCEHCELHVEQVHNPDLCQHHAAHEHQQGEQREQSDGNVHCRCDCSWLADRSNSYELDLIADMSLLCSSEIAIGCDATKFKPVCKVATSCKNLAPGLRAHLAMHVLQI